MIQIKDLKKVQVTVPPATEGDDPTQETKVDIRYFVTVEDERFFQSIRVDDFDILTATLAQVKSMVEANADQEDIKQQYQQRKEREASTYETDGSGFRKGLKFVDWQEEGLNAEYEVNDVVEYNGILYRCIQGHTVNDISWTPEATAALWSSILVFADQYRPWQQPQGEHDAYPADAVVQHSGSYWKSTDNNNVTEPGTQNALWEEVDENGQPLPEPDPGTVSEWSPDSVDYVVDQEVTYEGTTYRCLQAHTSQAGWNPPAVPSLWEEVTP